MSNEEILKKSIEKAVLRGFSCKNGVHCEMVCEESSGICSYSTIFSHEFAKAFWGELNGIKNYSDGQSVYISGYLFHLQEMVLEKDPVKYLEQFLV